MDKLYKDILIKIFSYLRAKDIISCSQVNHNFYEASSDNHLWFEYFRVETNKYLKNPNMIVYNDIINYKIYYLSLFHRKYHLQIFNFYRSIYQFASRTNNSFEKSIVYFVYLPISIICLPIIIGIEFYEYISHCLSKYEYCSCDSCHRELSMKRINKNIC